MNYPAWIIAAAIIIIAEKVTSEIRFVCPPPARPHSNLINNKCSKEFADFATLSPGLFTIHFEEPVVRKGTAMRVELVDLSSPSFPCLLLDHIPHNDDLRVKDPENCKMNDYPVGQCGTSTYITVDIPDIRCEKCALMLKSFLIPSDGKVCADELCTWHFSCANVRIRPLDSSNVLSTYSCRNRYKDVIFPNWLMRSMVIYQPFANVLGSIFSKETFTFFDDHGKDTITYDFTVDRPVVIMFIQLKRSVRAALPMTTLNMVGTNQFKGSLPRDKLGQFRTAHLRGGPVLRISFRYIKNPAVEYYNYTAQLKIYDLNLYSTLSARYSQQGWLAEDRYVGDNAVYTDVVRPAGHCIPHTWQYGVSLRNATGDPAGVISILVNDFMHVTGVFPVSEAKWRLTYDGVPIPNNFISSNTLRASLRSSKAPASFKLIDERSGQDSAWGMVKKSLSAIIRDGNRTVGITILSLFQSNQYNVEYFLQNIDGRVDVPAAVFLTFPSSENILRNVTDGIVQTNGGWMTRSTFTANGDEFFLWTGHFGITSTGRNDTSSQFSAKFEAPNPSFCEGVDHKFCKVRHLVSQQGKGLEGRGFVQSRKYSATILSLRVFVKGLSVGVKVEDSYFYTRDPAINVFSSSFNMSFFSQVDHSFSVFKVDINLGTPNMAAWENEDLNIAVKLTGENFLVSKKISFTTVKTSRTTTTETTTTSPTTTSTTTTTKPLTTTDTRIPNTSLKPADTTTVSSKTPDYSTAIVDSKSTGIMTATKTSKDSTLENTNTAESTHERTSVTTTPSVAPELFSLKKSVTIISVAFLLSLLWVAE